MTPPRQSGPGSTAAPASCPPGSAATSVPGWWCCPTATPAPAPGRRGATWPDTTNRHVLITRKSALGTGPVSASYLADYLGRHQRGISLEHIRRDRILAEALATGADPLHLALVFNIDHTNAMAYANAARNLLSGPVPKDES